jgi:biotin carboxylase
MECDSRFLIPYFPVPIGCGKNQLRHYLFALCKMAAANLGYTGAGVARLSTRHQSPMQERIPLGI